MALGYFTMQAMLVLTSGLIHLQPSVVTNVAKCLPISEWLMNDVSTTLLTGVGIN